MKRYILSLIIIGLIIYAGSLKNQFVLDDDYQLTQNPIVHSLGNIPTLFLGSTFSGAANLAGIYYKPMMTSVYALIYSLFRADPFPYHLFQLLLHISNSVLVFILLKKFFNKNLSFILSLIFLVHPLNSESVLYISALQDPLFFFFGMIACIFVLKEKLKLREYVLFSIFISLSLLSKETGLLFLLISIIYRFLFFPGSKIKLVILSGIILVLYLLLRYLAVGLPISSDQAFPIMRASLLERAITAPAIIFYFFRNLIWPSSLSVGQMWVVKSINSELFYIPFLIDLIVIITILLLFKIGNNFKTALFFFIWLLIGLGAHIHLIPLDATVADRWFYFPMVGLLGIFGIAYQSLIKQVIEKLINPKEFRVYLLLMIAVLITSLSIRSYLRSLNWTNGLTLALHDEKINTDSFALENNLGFELIKAGRFNDSLPHLEKSTLLAPWWWLNWNNLGVAYRHFGYVNHNPEYINKAQASFERATLSNKIFYLPYQNLADLYLNFKTPQETEKYIIGISSSITVNDVLLFDLAVAEYQLGKIDNAIRFSYQAQQINPNNSYNNQLYSALQNNQKIELATPNY